VWPGFRCEVRLLRGQKERSAGRSAEGARTSGDRNQGESKSTAGHGDLVTWTKQYKTYPVFETWKIYLILFFCDLFLHHIIPHKNYGASTSWEHQATPLKPKIWSINCGNEWHDKKVPKFEQAPGWWFQALFTTKACFLEDDHYLWDESPRGFVPSFWALVGDGWPRSHKKVAWAKDTWLGRSDQWCGFPPRP